MCSVAYLQETPVLPAVPGPLGLKEIQGTQDLQDYREIQGEKVYLRLPHCFNSSHLHTKLIMLI